MQTQNKSINTGKFKWTFPKIFSLLLAATFLFLACNTSDDDDGGTPTPSVKTPDGVKSMKIEDGVKNKIIVTLDNSSTIVGNLKDTFTLAVTGDGATEGVEISKIEFKASSTTVLEITLNKDLSNGDKIALTYRPTTSSYIHKKDARDTKLAAFEVNNTVVNNIKRLTTASISSATYVEATGVLTIAGTNLPTAVNKWDFTKLKIAGKGGVGSEKTLDAHAAAATNTTTGTNPTKTSLTITFKGSHKVAVDTLLDVTGTHAGDLFVYNLKAEAGTFKDALAVEDENSNPITVTVLDGGTDPTIGDGTNYTESTGVLSIAGANLPTTIGGWDLTKVTITGQGNDPTPLHAMVTAAVFTSAENATKATSTDGRTLTVTFKGTHKSDIVALLGKNGSSATDGTTYGIIASEGTFRNFADVAVVSKGITVIAIRPTLITLATANGTGTLGKIDTGDRIILTFSEAMDAATIGRQFYIKASETDATIVISKGADTTAGAIATLVPSAAAAKDSALTFTSANNGTWSVGNTVLTIVLATRTAGTVADNSLTALKGKIGGLAVDAAGNAGNTGQADVVASVFF